MTILKSDSTIIADLASQIGSYLAAPEAGSKTSRWVLAHGPSAKPTLGPEMEIWVLGANASRDLRGTNAGSLAKHRVIELSENSRTWHYQILRDGKTAVGFAEAALLYRRIGKEAWEVHSMGLLPASARQFEKGLARVKGVVKRRSSTTKIRLLRIPGLDIGIFWIETPGADRIQVFRKPPSILGLTSTKLYEWADFVKILAKRFSRKPAQNVMGKLPRPKSNNSSTTGAKTG